MPSAQQSFNRNKIAVEYGKLDTILRQVKDIKLEYVLLFQEKENLLKQ